MWKCIYLSRRICIVRELTNNLLLLPAIEALHLIQRVNQKYDQNYDLKIQRLFPNLFKGLGNLGKPYKIRLRPNAKPFPLYTLRCVPLPLQTKVKTELERMESLGVIMKVEEATEWCAGMVVDPRNNGKVRICINLKPLNETVNREIHPLPAADETLAQLSGATVFTKLDANSCFWQILLAKESHQLTTFITPFSMYAFNKLSAPEHVPKSMSRILNELEGVVCLINDILVVGQD